MNSLSWKLISPLLLVAGLLGCQDSPVGSTRLATPDSVVTPPLSSRKSDGMDTVRGAVAENAATKDTLPSKNPVDAQRAQDIERKKRPSKPYTGKRKGSIETGKYILPPATLGQKEQIPTCKAVFGRIKADWSHNSTTGLYEIAPNSKERLVNEIAAAFGCFYSLGQEEVGRLFGKPDTAYRRHIAYYLEAPCLQENGIGTSGCEYLDCTFDHEGRLEEIHFSYSENVK